MGSTHFGRIKEYNPMGLSFRDFPKIKIHCLGWCDIMSPVFTRIWNFQRSTQAIISQISVVFTKFQLVSMFFFLPFRCCSWQTSLSPPITELGYIKSGVYSIRKNGPLLLFLGGGFKYFLFSTLPGEDSHFDQYFSIGLKPPARFSLWANWKCFQVFFIIFYAPNSTKHQLSVFPRKVGLAHDFSQSMDAFNFWVKKMVLQ